VSVSGKIKAKSEGRGSLTFLIKWRKEKKEEKIGKEIGKPKCHFPFSGFAKHAHRGHFAFAVFLLYHTEKGNRKGVN
jgi:hypothetical protein